MIVRNSTSRVPLVAVAFTVCVAMLGVSCDGGGDSGAGTPAAAATAATEVSATAPEQTLSERAEALCDAPATPLATVTVQVPAAAEISGLAAGRANGGVLWAHNDSGDVARVLAFTTGGEPRGEIRTGGAEAVDWEDMAIGPGQEPDTDYLYLGDIGDNAAQRPDIVVYRLPEPMLSGETTTVAAASQTIALRYPDAPHDAETLLVDPFTGELIIITKEIVGGNAGVYVASADMLEAGGGTMERAGEITKQTLTTARDLPESAPVLARGVGYVPTGGDISADGRLIAIRTYASVWIWARHGDASVAETLISTPCEAPSAFEQQGEAIAFAADGDAYYTISEGAEPQLHRFGIE